MEGPGAVNARQLEAGHDINLGPTTNNYFGQSPASGLTSLHQLPAPPSTFTGREAELKELLANVREGGVTITGLQGMGGVGKTTLAVVLADRLKADYPDAQFYFNLQGAASQPRSPADALAHVIRGFHSEARLPEEVEALRSLYLSTLHDKRVLLLMDNAADHLQVEPLLPPVGCLLLVTSRQHFRLPGLACLDLGSLPPEDAQGLVLRICPRASVHAGRMAELSGFLALALEANASALLTQPLLTPEQFMAKLAKTSERLKPVEAAFSVSYDLLAVELQCAWRHLAVFSGSFDARAAAAVWQIKEEAALERLTALINASLVEHDSRSQRVRLHDLARLFAAGRLSNAERDAAHLLLAQHFCRVLGEANELFSKGNDSMLVGLLLYDCERPNIEAGWALATGRPKEDHVAAKLIFDYTSAGGYVTTLRHHPRQRIEWLTTAVAATRRLGDKRSEGRALGNLGSAHAAMGDNERAIEFYEQRLAIAREIEDRLGEGTALANLGRAWTVLGELPKAVALCDQAVARFQELGERRAESSALGTLGTAHAAARDYRKAIGFYMQHLAISREIGDRRGEAEALCNLGNAYGELGETAKAVETCNVALATFRELKYRRGEGEVLSNLGIAYAVLGDFAKAFEFHEQHLTIAREIGDRRGEGNALGNLGNACMALGKAKNAIEYYTQNLSVTRQLKDRRGEGNSLGNLAHVYAALGQTQRALEYCDQRLVMARETGDSRGEGNALFNSALILDRLGQRAEAISHVRKALKIFTVIESPSAAAARAKLEEWQAI